MEYPGSHFTKFWRKVFLIFFVVLFSIAAPTILLYAMGYTYDWQNGLLRKTGSVSIDILTKEAAAYLDNVKIEEIMPIRLKNIVPKKYHLSLRADGYYDWQKEIEVKDKETVYIKEISLLKKNYPQKIGTAAPKILSLSNNGRYLAYALEKTPNLTPIETEIFLLDTKNAKIRTTEIKISGAWPRLDWSPDDRFLAVTKETDEAEEIFIIAADETKDTWRLTAPDKTKITKSIWQSTPQPEIFFSTAEMIMTANPDNQKITVVTKNIYSDWSSEDGQIWTLQFNTSTKKYLLTKNALGFASTFAEFETNLGADKPKNPPQILAAAAGQVLIQMKPGNLMIINQNSAYPIIADSWRLSPYNNWWLFWTAWEITTYSAGQTPYLLTRSGENLRDVWPLDQYNTLGLVWGKRVEALFPYYSVSNNLLDYEIQKMTADSNNKIIYFSGKIGTEEGLWKLEY